MKTSNFNLKGMNCAACVANVEKSIKKLPGIEALTVSLLSNSMQVTYDELLLTENDIILAVKKAGYSAFLKGKKQESVLENTEDETVSMKKRLIFSVILLIVLMYLSMSHMFSLPCPAFLLGAENAGVFSVIQLILCIAILFLNRAYYQNGLKHLLHRSPNMDSLIAIGSGASFLYGLYAMFSIISALGHGDLATAEGFSMKLYFESAAMIVTLVTIGKYLETRAKKKTGSAIEKLMDLSPKTATVLRGEEPSCIPIEEVVVGDILLVYPGDSIPVDGIIIEGASSVDESMLTGKSIPVDKTIGSNVSAGTVNTFGFFQMQAKKIGKDTALSGIIALIEKASSSKAPVAKLADRVAAVFVPVVMGIAFLSAILWLIFGSTLEFALTTGISVLVISCPCALGLATPVAIMVGMGKGAENGILVKSAEALEKLCSVKMAVFDKTGTLTEGKPTVTDLFPFGISELELLRYAASLEERSKHPLALAVLDYAKEKNISLFTIEAFETEPGKGIKGMINGKILSSGNLLYMKENNIDCSPVEAQIQSYAQAGKTPLVFQMDGKIIGMIAVADKLKPSSEKLAQELQPLFVETVMLTGDNEITAQAFAKKANISRVFADVLPSEKEKIIAALQKENTIAMIGDGINDAPALMRADIGIAIGAGTDIAIESADIVLTKSDPLDVKRAICLSKAVLRNIKQNLFWAFFYNSIGIPIAAGALFIPLGIQLSPMIGAAAMSLSSVCVVLNALRLRLLNFDHTKKEKNIMKEYELTVEGMMCMHCQKSVLDAISKLKGISNAKVDLQAKTASFSASDAKKKDAAKTAIINAGYTVTCEKEI